MRIVAYNQQEQPTNLDLYGDEEITIKYEVDNIREANSKNSTYSKSYDIPATKKNNKFFRGIYDLSSDIKLSTNNPFNPYKSCNVEIYADGTLILDGIMFLNEIKERATDFSYNVTVFSQSVGLLDALGDSTIADLDFEDIEHSKTISNIQNSNTAVGITLSGGGTSQAVMYPLVDDGGIGYNTLGFGVLDIDSRYNLPPCIQLKYLVDKIFAFAGYSYDSTFFTNTEFTNIYMDSSTNSEYSEVTEYATVEAKPTSNQSIPTSYTDIVFGDEIQDANGLHNATTGVYTAPADNLEVNCVLSLGIINTSGSARTVDFRLVHNSSATNQPTSPVFVGSTNIPANGITLVNIFHYDEVLLNNGETVKWQWRSSGSGVTCDLAYPVPGTTPPYTFISKYYFTTNNREDGGYIFQHNRRDIKLADIIRDLTKMFNLIIEPDKTNPKKLNILPFNDYVAGGTEHNWTNKVDRSEMTQEMFELPRKLTFAMAEDEDDAFLNRYKSVVGKEYGIQEVLIDVETDKEEEIRLDVFAPTAVAQMSTDYAEISIITKSEDGVNFERFSNAPRLFFKNYKEYNTSNNIFDLVDVYEGSFAVPLTKYSTAHHYEDGANFLGTSDSNLLFGNVGFLFHTVNTLPLNTFYTKYWRDYVLERYVNLSHIIKVRIYLKSKDIDLFSFKDTIRIDNQIYRVNSIEYTTGAEKLAKVELYRI